LQLDLGHCCAFDPYGAVALVLFLKHLPPEVLPVELLLPGFSLPLTEEAGANPVTFLTRMGFWEEVREQLLPPPGGLPERPMRSPDRNVLIDLTRLHSRDSVNVMLRKSGEILHHFGYAPISRGHVLEVLSELSSNVLDHSQAELGGMMATQTYKMQGGTRYLVMAIGDRGIGVRRSLAANMALADRLDDDDTALSVAVQPGNSRFTIGGRGGGLPRVLSIAKRYQGNVVFRSGIGALTYVGARDEKKIFKSSQLAGTQLRIMLPENRVD
jgi:hypothetical protein